MPRLKDMLTLEGECYRRGEEIERLTKQRDELALMLAEAVGVCQAFAEQNQTAKSVAERGHTALASVEGK